MNLTDFNVTELSSSELEGTNGGTAAPCGQSIGGACFCGVLPKIIKDMENGINGTIQDAKDKWETIKSWF